MNPNSLYAVMLKHLFDQAAEAGFGRVQRRNDGGWLFEAYPGCEDAAADFIEAKLAEDMA